MKDSNELHLFFDTETSGFISDKKSYDAPDQAWCCQIGAILSTKDEIIDTLDVIIKANGRKMPSFLVNLHGISAERADLEGIEEDEALELFANLMKDTPKRICHNYDFDFKFIDHLFKRNMDTLTDEARSKYFLQLPHFCTMKDPKIKNYIDARNKKGGLKWPKLEEMYKFLFEEDFPNAHNALADAQATRKCYYELLKRGIILE